MDALGKTFCLKAVVVFSVIGLMGCSKATDTLPQPSWSNGHPAYGLIKCATCHIATRPATTATEVRTTSNGRSYTVHFHNIVPTGFNEDPAFISDCSTCHNHDLGWKAGNFGPAGAAHLTDSLGNQVSRCLDCHEYPADFWQKEHTTSQAKGFDCSICHLLPTEVGGTKPGGFGDL